MLEDAVDVVADDPIEESVDDQVKVIGPLRISIPLFNIFLNEADEWSRLLCGEVSEWVLQPHLPMPANMEALVAYISTASRGYCPEADSAESMTASAPW